MSSPRPPAPTPTLAGSQQGPIVVFDGVCTLCNAALDFILRHEAGPHLRFSAAQTPPGMELTRAALGPALPAEPSTMLVFWRGRVFVRSSAALIIARYLRWPYRALLVFWLVPRPVRDAAYDFVARHRYAWFGRRGACRVPTPELQARFLDGALDLRPAAPRAGPESSVPRPR